MKYKLATVQAAMKIRKKHIVLLTSGQPATNPRLLKEADCLHAYGYEVTVICCYWNAWANFADKQLMSSRSWKCIQVGGNPVSNKSSYVFSRIIHLLCVIASKLNLPLRKYAISRATRPLMHAAKAIKADMYIAHNLAALPAAVEASKKHQAVSGFDAEDYHRAETAAIRTDFNTRLKVFLEDLYVPQLSYFTTSTTLIAQLYAGHYGINPTVIRNVFPKTAASIASKITVEHASIKLCWFSQTIGPNRGLEVVLQALSQLNEKQYELHLLGAMNFGYAEVLSTLAEQLGLPANKIHIHGPLAPDALSQFCSAFDIGLASEPGFCTNNQVALSNKLFTYIQSSLAVLLSDTAAQRLFYDEHPGIGLCYERSNSAQLADSIQYYIDHRDVLQQTKLNNYQLGQQSLNWETESQHLIGKIKSSLHE